MTAAVKRGRPPKADKLSGAERARRYRQRKGGAKVTPERTAAGTIVTLQEALDRAHGPLREKDEVIAQLNERIAELNERIAELTRDNERLNRLLADLRESVDTVSR